MHYEYFFPVACPFTFLMETFDDQKGWRLKYIFLSVMVCPMVLWPVQDIFTNFEVKKIVFDCFLWEALWLSFKFRSTLFPNCIPCGWSERGVLIQNFSFSYITVSWKDFSFHFQYVFHFFWKSNDHKHVGVFLDILCYSINWFPHIINTCSYSLSSV